MAYRSKNCKICGNEFMPHARNNTVCENEECQKKRQKINYEGYLKRKEERMRKAENERNIENSIEEILRHARKAGMSYGKYVLMLSQKSKIEERS